MYPTPISVTKFPLILLAKFTITSGEKLKIKEYPPNSRRETNTNANRNVKKGGLHLNLTGYFVTFIKIEHASNFVKKRLTTTIFISSRDHFHFKWSSSEP